MASRRPMYAFQLSGNATESNEKINIFAVLGEHGFRDNEVLLQAGYEVIVISPPGALQAILHDIFWKICHDFLIAFYSNVLSGMHGFRDNEVYLVTDLAVIVSPPPGGAS